MLSVFKVDIEVRVDVVFTAPAPAEAVAGKLLEAKINEGDDGGPAAAAAAAAAPMDDVEEDE